MHSSLQAVQKLTIQLLEWSEGIGILKVVQQKKRRLESLSARGEAQTSTRHGKYPDVASFTSVPN